MLVVSDSATLTIAPAFQGQRRLYRSAGRLAPAFQGQRRLCRSAGRLAITWLCMLVTSDSAAFTDNTIAQGQRHLPSTWFVRLGARPVVSSNTARCRGLTSAGSCVSSDTSRRGLPWAWSLQDQW